MTPQPLSAQQRNSIRATARHEWMQTKDVNVAICSAKLVVCGMVGGEQLATAHRLVSKLVKHWSENAIANPDAAPMYGEPGLPTSPLRGADCEPKEYYQIANSIWKCHAPGKFVTSQGEVVTAYESQFFHLPRYIADGGEPYEIGKQLGQEPLPDGYWEDERRKAREGEL